MSTLSKSKNTIDNILNTVVTSHSHVSSSQETQLFIAHPSNHTSTEDSTLKLPAEIRLKIWVYASNHPCVIELCYRLSRRRRFTDCKTPAILHACSESRQEALKKYEVLKIENKLSNEEYDDLSTVFMRHVDKCRAAGQDVSEMKFSPPSNFGYFCTYINYDQDILYLPYRQYHQKILYAEYKMWEILMDLGPCYHNSNRPVLRTEQPPAVLKLKHFATQSSIFESTNILGGIKGVSWLFEILFRFSKNLTTLSIVHEDENDFANFNLQEGPTYVGDKLSRVGKILDFEPQALEIPGTGSLYLRSQASRYKKMIWNVRRNLVDKIQKHSNDDERLELKKLAAKLDIIPLSCQGNITSVGGELKVWACFVAWAPIEGRRDSVYLG